MSEALRTTPPVAPPRYRLECLDTDNEEDVRPIGDDVEVADAPERSLVVRAAPIGDVVERSAKEEEPEVHVDFQASLDDWLSKMLAATGVAEIIDEAFPAPTAVPDDAAAAPDDVPRELQSLFAALDAAEGIADDDYTDTDDALIVLPSSPSAFNVHCRAKEHQSLLASLEKAEAIADNSEVEDVQDEPIYVNITAPIAHNVPHVCAADPRGASAPHSRSKELQALLASLEKAEAIADAETEPEDVLDDVNDALTIVPIPDEVVLDALDAPRCRSKDLLSLLASLDKAEAVTDYERDIEARIDEALAVPTDHGRAVDLVSYLESMAAEDEAAPVDVIAVPTSPSGSCTLPTAAYIDSVVSQVAAARAAVEAAATIDMEEKGRLPTISENINKAPSTTWSLPRTINTDAYGLLFVGGATERSIAAAKSRLVTDAPLGQPSTIEVESKKQKGREEEKKHVSPSSIVVKEVDIIILII